MTKRIVSALVAGIFVFLLGMTAADYCGPKPKQPRLETQAALAKFNQIKFKKAHHPCVSLKSSYDLASAFRMSGQEIFGVFKSSLFLIGKIFVLQDNFVGSDSSPPPADPPPPTVPIFQFHSNLRI